MACDECRGHIKVLHPDDDPICAFRALMEKLEISKQEAVDILTTLEGEVQFGSSENLAYLDTLKEEEPQ